MLVQRVAVLKEFRSVGAGRAIMKTIIKYAREQKGVKKVLLGAQVPAIGFYEKLGFISIKDTYVEAGIEHESMYLNL